MEDPDAVEMSAVLCPNEEDCHSPSDDVVVSKDDKVGEVCAGQAAAVRKLWMLKKEVDV